MKYTIKGKPISQKRHRHTKKGFTYDPLSKEKKIFKLKILEQKINKYKTTKTTKDPVNIHILFYFKRPKSHYRTGKYCKELKKDVPFCHITKPDVDNLAKFVLDGLTGVLYKDDNQVTSITAIKLYDEEERTEFNISTIRGQK